MRKFIIGALLMLVASNVFANTDKMSAYTQVLTSAKDNSFKQSVSSKVSAFVFTKKANINIDSIANIYDSKVVFSLNDTLFTANIPVSRIEDFSNDEMIDFIEVGMPVEKQIATARTFCGVNDAQNGLGLPNGFTGKDVIVGIVDLGFQYNHIGFYDPNDNYTTLRVKQVLNIANSWVYETQEEIETAGKDVSGSDGHGTHVANIAAGSFSDATNDFRGVAPESDIILASIGSSGSVTDITNCVMYAFNYAKSKNKPIVVNLSLGTEKGPHDGLSTFDVAMDKQVGEGKILVGAVGNYGQGKLYKELTLSASQDSTCYMKNFSTARDNFIDIYGSENQTYSVYICFQETSTGNIVYSKKVSAGQTYNDFSTYGYGSIYVGISKGKYNYRTETYVGLNSFKAKSGYKFGVKIVPASAGKFQMWGGDVNFAWEGETSTSYTVSELGGTGKNTITVGAFTSLSNSYSFGKTVGQICSFSGIGPTADGRMKPEVTAPGDVLFSALPSDVAGAQGKQVISYGGNNYNFGYISGTSMSTPFVSGVVALWLQADSTLTPDDVKEILAETSTTDEYTGVCPNNTWGYGKINALAGLKKILKITSKEHVLIDEKRILLSETENECNLLFLNDEQNVVILLYNAQGKLLSQEKIGDVLRADEVSVSLTNCSAGVCILKVDTDKITQAFKFIKK